jgi:hypothetical protein
MLPFDLTASEVGPRIILVFTDWKKTRRKAENLDCQPRYNRRELKRTVKRGFFPNLPEPPGNVVKKRRPQRQRLIPKGGFVGTGHYLVLGFGVSA